MSGLSNTELPCGHRAEYRDQDPAEGVHMNWCPTCGWQKNPISIGDLVDKLYAMRKVKDARDDS